MFQMYQYARGKLCICWWELKKFRSRQMIEYIMNYWYLKAILNVNTSFLKKNNYYVFINWIKWITSHEFAKIHNMPNYCLLFEFSYWFEKGLNKIRTQRHLINMLKTTKTITSITWHNRINDVLVYSRANGFNNDS